MTSVKNNREKASPFGHSSDLPDLPAGDVTVAVLAISRPVGLN